MTLAWVESEIEKTLAQGNGAKAVYDLAALVTVRAYLLGQMPHEKAAGAETDPHQDTKRDRITLTAYSADLRKVPTIEQVEAALGAVAVNTPEEKQRVRDARTWAEIIKGKS